MKQEIKELKQEIKEIEQDGFALEIVKDYKKQNKRQFIIILVLIVCWFITGAYLVYLLNDIGVEETITEEYTQEIDDVGAIDNSNINNGGVINGKN